MVHQKVKLAAKVADAYIIPLGKINLVNVVTDKGMVGCGAFDVEALDNFGYPAARVRPSAGSSISTAEDILKGIIKDANNAAVKLGVEIGMSGEQALEKM